MGETKAPAFLGSVHKKEGRVSALSEVIAVERDGHVATMFLDRPERRNALGRAFWHDLPLVVSDLQANRDVRVIVLAARGQDFTVGLDLKEMGTSLAGDATDDGSPAQRHRRVYDSIRDLQSCVSSLAHARVPVIAAVHGYCIGGGIDLICACDIRLSTNSAMYSVRETRLAIVADLGTLQRLPRIVGAGHAAELAYTGRDFTAEHAEKIGLVNRCAGDGADDVLHAAHQLAREIAINSPLAVEGTKSVLAANDGATIEQGLDFVARWNTMYLASNDLRESLNAFAERRAPDYRGD